MKTIDNLRKFFPVVVLSTVLIASTIEVNAQKHHKEGKDRDEHDRKEYRESDRYDNRTVDNGSRYDRNRNYKQNNWNDRDNEYEYRSKYSKKYKNQKSDYYNHPSYGRVYQRFDHNPLVFRHNSDNYYYYDDHFYNYRNGIGYCVVEAPRNTYFRDLPFDCERVYVNGNILFRNGDLYFKHSSRGYINVPSPVQIRISARF